jgi:hypothetical protein
MFRILENVTIEELSPDPLKAGREIKRGSEAVRKS